MVLYILGTGIYLQPFTVRTWLRIGLSLVVFVVFWHVLRAIILYVRERYPNRQQTAQRLILTFMAGVPAAVALSWLSGVLRHFVQFGTFAHYQNTDQASSFTLNNLKISLHVFGVDVFQAIITVGFYQVIYEILFFVQKSTLDQKRLRQAEQEREKLRTANLQSQLDALKQQVNPHFLFNSLNVLDSLIEEDPKQARVFLDELSTVYRYLLRSNRDSNLTELSNELDFINSYYHLLKTRHGAGLSLTVDVNDRYQDHQLPPLTLQLLVENAVKHNIVMVEQPLHIDIFIDSNGQLEVRNNIQRKTIRVASNGIGLTNILAKYQVLNQPPPIIREGEGQFVVTLPLIKA